MNAPLFSREAVVALAPPVPPNNRQDRFSGVDVGVPLSIFTPDVATSLQEMYAQLRDLLGELQHQSPAAWSECLEVCDAAELTRVLRGLRVSEADGSRQRTRQVLHDLRGGTLQALVMYLDLAASGVLNPSDMMELPYLLRDALKVMRNCITDLDEERRRRDTEERDHDVKLLCEKWSRGVGCWGGQQVRIVVERELDAVVSETCLELSTLDRVLGNLVSNAARHARDRTVAIHILRPSETSPNIRFVVSNRVSEDQRERLHTLLADGAEPLFRSYSTTGSGLGLGIVADFVMRAYGLSDLERALDCGHLGVRLIEDVVVVWIHWPTGG